MWIDAGLNASQSVCDVKQKRMLFKIERDESFEKANWQQNQMSQRLRKMSSEKRLWI